MSLDSLPSPLAPPSTTTNTNNTKHSAAYRIFSSLDGVPGLLAQMELLKTMHSKYKRENVQPSPQHLQR